MRPLRYDRDGFWVDVDRKIPYGQLRKYVCEACGGGLVHRSRWDFDLDRSVDEIACAECGGEDIISEQVHRQRIADGMEAMADLPEWAREMYGLEKPKTTDAQQAIRELFPE